MKVIVYMNKNVGGLGSYILKSTENNLWGTEMDGIKQGILTKDDHQGNAGKISTNTVFFFWLLLL